MYGQVITVMGIRCFYVTTAKPKIRVMFFVNYIRRCKKDQYLKNSIAVYINH